MMKWPSQAGRGIITYNCVDSTDQVTLLLTIPRRDGSDENMRGRLRDHHNTIKST